MLHMHFIVPAVSLWGAPDTAALYVDGVIHD